MVEQSIKPSAQAPVKIWGLSDLHLHYATLPNDLDFISEANEPAWLKNARKIAKAWAQTVSHNDIVLIPGDLSSARNHAQVQRDLAWLAKRPCGRAVISPGNHDLWFGRLSGLAKIMRPNQIALDGNAVDLGPVVICGARSAPTPDDPSEQGPKTGTPERTAYDKFQKSLELASSLRDASGIDKPIIALWHHPPFDRWGRPDPVVGLMAAQRVHTCVYGHIHTQLQWQSTPQGKIEGIKFICVAADSIAFQPRLVFDLARDIIE